MGIFIMQNRFRVLSYRNALLEKKYAPVKRKKYAHQNPGSEHFGNEFFVIHPVGWKTEIVSRFFLNKLCVQGNHTS